MSELQTSKIIMESSYEIINLGDTQQEYDYHVTFRLGDKCNLACEYCRWYDGDNYKLALESIDKIFEFFVFEKFKRVSFYYHGGEGGIHPHVIKSLEKLREKEKSTGIKVDIEFQTNLSYKKSRLQGIINLINKISISYHFNELFNKNLHDQFVSNLEWLMSINYKIDRFDVMLDDVPEQELNGFYERIKKWLQYENIIDSEMIHSFCHYDKNPVTKQQHLDFYNKYNKTEQLYKVDGKQYNSNELFGEGLNCKGKLCEAGSKYIVLNADGNVFTCGIEMTFYRMGCMEGVKPTTNVVTDPNFLKILSIRRKTMIRCKYDYCGGDFYIQKHGG